MKKKNFSICQDCIFLDDCVLTNDKKKVWSCSEYDNNLDHVLEVESKHDSTILNKEPEESKELIML